MSITDQIDPPWQTANIFVLFNAGVGCNGKVIIFRFVFL